MAIRDAGLLLAYCYKNYDDIIELDDDLDKLLSEIIGFIFILVSGNLDRMLIYTDTFD